MMADDDDRKTGIFYVKDPTGIVVMLDGEVTVWRYKSKREFVEAHVKGMAALEREMAEMLERHYKPEGSQ
ncbi:MAG: hypothetical protein U5O39_08130 [Gammaproteobacteria bacterium]|nr:hypothetical protein [Gammaproteobacteria bacterium]